MNRINRFSKSAGFKFTLVRTRSKPRQFDDVTTEPMAFSLAFSLFIL